MGKAIVIISISFLLIMISCTNHYRKSNATCDDKDLQMKNLLKNMLDVKNMQQVFKIPKQSKQDCFPIISDCFDGQKIILEKFGKPVKFLAKEDYRKYEAVLRITKLDFFPNHVKVTSKYDATGTVCIVLFRAKDCNWIVEDVVIEDY